MFKNMRLVIVFDMFLNPSFKMTASFVNIDKGNGIFIADKKLYEKAIQKRISDTSKFENLNEDPTLKREALRQWFLGKLEQKNFLTKMDTINCILLVLLLLVSKALLKCAKFPP